MILTIQIVALTLLLILSGFFSGAETALFSLNPIQIHRFRRRHPRTGERIEDLLASPQRLLSTLLIGNTLINVTASGIGFYVVATFLDTHAVPVSIGVMTSLLLIVGEVAPKRLAMARPLLLAGPYARVLTRLIVWLTPVRRILERTGAIFKEELEPDQESLSEDEFLTGVEVGEEEGVLDEEERSMVDGIIRLAEMQASDAMTPRVDLVGIDLDDPPEGYEATARSVMFRYIPLYRESLDHPEGFLDVPHFLLSPDLDLAASTVPPRYVPETTPLDTLLLRFQKEKLRVAFVTDEYGGTAGLITRGDILEEIVADVDNEYAETHPEIQKTGPDRWLVAGNTSLEVLNYELDMDLEAEGADRLSGWVTAQAEHIPRQGEVVEAQGCRATVQKVRKRRVTSVKVERCATEDAS